MINWIVGGVVSAILIVFSPLAVAATSTISQIPTEPTNWMRDYGPVGALVMGILILIAGLFRTIRPKIEAWLDSGTAERLAMRDLAKSLQSRFSDEAIEERKLSREALEMMRAWRANAARGHSDAPPS